MKNFITFGLLVSIVASATAQNLYTNGTFETPGTGGAPQSWKPFSPPMTGTSVLYRESPGDAPQGQNYVRVTNTTDQTGFDRHFFHGWGAEPQVILDPNVTVRISYKYRRSSSAIVRSMAIGTACWNCFSLNRDYSPDLTDGFPGPPVDVGVVGAWADHSQLYYTGALDDYTTMFWFGAAKSSLVDYFTPLPAGNYVDYDDIKLELVERHTSGTYYVSGAHSYSVANTSCTITFTEWSASSQCQQTVELKSGTPPGITVPSLPRYVDISDFTPAPTSFQARVALHYTDAELATAGLNESQLQLQRKQGNGPWEVVPATVDPIQNTITMTGTTDHFSLWTITSATPSAAQDWDLLY